MTAEATATVPGHVTAFFSPVWRDDPERTGARGAGLTVTDGVRVTAQRAGGRGLTLNGEVGEVEAVDRVLGALDADVRLVAETTLPIGAGFGVSGALALGSALATNAVLAGDRTENTLVSIAHRADVEAGTGLGDVVAQARGGLPIRLAPGGPGHGILDGIPATCRLEYRSFGDIDTASLITGDVEAITAAGDRAMERLLDSPSVPGLFEAARRFAADTELLTPRVREAIRAVDGTGEEAAMAMLGDTVIATGNGLSAAGYDATATRTHPGGATLEME